MVFLTYTFTMHGSENVKKITGRVRIVAKSAYYIPSVRPSVRPLQSTPLQLNKTPVKFG
jgi:hypothetical protein